MIRTKTMFLCLGGGIFVLGAALRFYHINFQSLWLEELHDVILADPKHHILTITDIGAMFGSKAFYLFLHLVFEIFSYEDIVGRVAFALIGILALPVIYFLGKEFDSPETGLFAALLAAINYYHIHYSQEVNFYSMGFLFSALSYLFFIRSYKYLKEGAFAAYVVSTILLLHTHSFGFIVFLAQIITVVVLSVMYKAEKKFWRGFVIAAVSILIFAPWTQVLVSELLTGHPWMPKPAIYALLSYFYNYSGKDVLVTIIFAALIILFFRSFIRPDANDEQKKPLHLILILWLVLVYVLPFIKSFIGNSILDMRFTIIFLPALLIAVAVGWSKLKKTKWKLVCAVCIVLSSLINLLFLTEHYTKVQKQQIREVSNFVKTNNKAQHAVFSSSSREFNFYFPDPGSTVNPLDSLDRIMDLSVIDKAWILRINPSEEELLILSGKFRMLEKHSFHETEALLIQKK